LVHPRTVEAFAKAGVNYKDFHEKGHDVAIREKKEQLKNDKNTKTTINAVYRKKVEDENRNPIEVIAWWAYTTGKTGLGNPVEYTEGPDDLAYWLEPIATTRNIFNPETEEMQTVTTQWDFSDMKKHYLYPFNAENIAMIKKITAISPKCSWIVEDGVTGRSREVKNFEDWSSKDFDTLLNPPKQPLTRQELDRLLGLGLQHQVQDTRPQYR
jgi:hypothetical protein